MSELPDAAIEAAADAIWNTLHRAIRPWSEASEAAKRAQLNEARVAIEAAMPAIREAAADELLELAHTMDGEYKPTFLDGVRYAAAHLASTACPPIVRGGTP